MSRWMNLFCRGLALLAALTFGIGIGRAEDAPGDGTPSPLKPLFEGPPLTAPADAAPAENSEAEEGTAELGPIEPVSFNEEADGEELDEEDIAEGELEDAAEEAVEEPAAEAVEEEPAPLKAAPPVKAPTKAPTQTAPAKESPAAKSDEKEVETATFSGIRPGESTQAQVHETWGQPGQTFEDAGVVHEIFSVEPFKEIDVSYDAEKVASIVIFMEQSFSANELAQQLGLDNLQAVIIPDGKGKWLGQSYPERGVMFGFDPEQSKEKIVAQMVLEPISGLPFLLRAEVRMKRDYTLALKDLDYAVQLDPKLARAHALRAQVLLAMMHWNDAKQAADTATKIEPTNPELSLLKARVFRESGDYAGAVIEARQAMANAEKKQLVKAACLVELARAVAEGPDRDFRRAADYSLEAIKLTEKLVSSQQAATRREARIVALDANLELAGAISWGFWRQKEVTAPKWLDKAQALADQLAEEDKAGDEYRLRVASKALTAAVGLKGAIDPTPWVKALQDAGGKQLAAYNDPVRHRQLEWQVGTALYDAMQAYHQLEAYAEALEVGTLAASALEHVNEDRQPLESDAYLLGRLYFRLGTLHVAKDSAHDKAVVWFDKARPLVEKPLPAALKAEIGRQGETLVSMAVSYWSAGQQDEALALTDSGAKLMEQGIEEGVLDPSAVKVPYTNLATMHRYLGNEKDAKRFDELAANPAAAQRK